MNAANENDIKKMSSNEKLKINQDEADLKSVLSTLQGRRYIFKILSMSGIYKLSADNSGSWTYFNEGKRAVGLNLLSDIMAVSPEVYPQMLLENKKEKENDNVNDNRRNN
jgi:hypothetical protein